MFFDCIHYESIWGACGLLNEVRNAMEASESFCECLFKLLQNLNETNKITFLMMLWAIWRRHNDKVWEVVLQPVNVVISKVMEYMYEWKWARVSKQGATAGSVQQQSEELICKKPSVGHYKCNIDAALLIR